MFCNCVEKAFYALKCADIPLYIFSSVECSIHSAAAAGTKSSSTGSVSIFLCPDTAVWESENISKWPVVYYGTDISGINSILTHGMLLMPGDTRCDGTEEPSRRMVDDATSAIWTFPEPEEAASCDAEVAVFDEKKTVFTILVRLRQKPGTYRIHNSRHGFDMWSTNRRGTLYIEALDVRVFKSRDTLYPYGFLPVPTHTYFTSFKCTFERQAFRVLELLKLPQSIFNMTDNRCYCPHCYPADWHNSMDVAGETYAIPRGWMRFGLLTNPAFIEMNDIWKSWPIAFHGCHPANVISIVKNRTLLIPHDVLPNGKELTVWSSADEKQKYYFVSPAIGYSAHPWYAKPVQFKDTDGKKKYFQTVLVFKVRSGTYSKKKETESEQMKLFDDYSIIDKNEVEWYSLMRGCTHPYGLLIRVIDAHNLEELNEFFHLKEDSHFRQTREFTLADGQR